MPWWKGLRPFVLSRADRGLRSMPPYQHHLCPCLTGEGAHHLQVGNRDRCVADSDKTYGWACWNFLRKISSLLSKSCRRGNCSVPLRPREQGEAPASGEAQAAGEGPRSSRGVAGNMTGIQHLSSSSSQCQAGFLPPSCSDRHRLL